MSMRCTHCMPSLAQHHQPTRLGLQEQSPVLSLFALPPCGSIGFWHLHGGQAVADKLSVGIADADSDCRTAWVAPAGAS